MSSTDALAAYWEQNLKPCGTEAAYKRHHKRGEQACDACLAAHAAYCAGHRSQPATGWDLKPCGTEAAYRRHLRRGEQPCQACTLASRLTHAIRTGGDTQPNTMAEDWRPIRNGIPWKPYRYNGLGYDLYEGPEAVAS